MPHLYALSVIINTMFHYRTPVLSGELQRQDVQRQQPCSTCQKPWRIGVQARGALIRSRVYCGVPIVNNRAKNQ